MNTNRIEASPVNEETIPKMGPEGRDSEAIAKGRKSRRMLSIKDKEYIAAIARINLFLLQLTKGRFGFIKIIILSHKDQWK